MKGILALLIALTTACQAVDETPKPAETSSGTASTATISTSTTMTKPLSHEEEILQWRAARVARLRKDDGWLTLVGLQWLSEGTNPIQNPAGSGSVVLNHGTVTLQPAAGSGLTIDGKPVTAPVVLADDSKASGPTVVERGSVKFIAIKRADRFGLRVRDTASDARNHFLGIDYFPIDPRWRVEARFEPYNPPRHRQVMNVLGFTTDEVAPGLLHFTIDGKEYSLEPILEQGETDYFIIFKDATSGKETYGAARYVYAHPPDANGKTVIDFNKAYNPPCAFTPFATCPLPGPQNRLPVAVTAGEKKYRGGHA
jgi:uncharacterized protein (DUF1684 family)